MEIVPLGPGFAAALRGVGIAEIAARPDLYKAVRAAFEEHSVLLFREQAVTDESQLAFTRCFGPWRSPSGPRSARAAISPS
ncbi:MAG TPA: TauD/TfdA family dioxygenase [Stellaceae bacterium]|nr:TauD/TfdA family dioxygenase [Stellaceae bacterium]